MKPTRKSLLTITTQAVKALLLLDPTLSPSDKLADFNAVKQAFMFDCCQAFSLDDSMITTNASIETWWATVLDLYHMDAMLRSAYPGEFM